MRYFIIILCVLSLTSLFAQNEEIELTSSMFGELECRHIGPAVMSGRISAIDAVNGDPRILYLGSAGGGIWKSTNGGTTFKPVFDDHIQSIGAITIDQKHPDTVWTGTGEPWVRNSVSVGDGIYRTTDGGKKWKHMGLEKSERINRIVIHPDNPNIIYAAVLGHLWNANEQRGLYRTTDGGTTWENILYVDENTGCSDIQIHPGNPDIMYAGMWEFRRYPYFFNSGGSGSGLYRSSDGGKNWQRITENLPDGKLGRVSLSVSPAVPERVYAIIESDNSALYRSDDSGITWQEVFDGYQAGERPFYFSLLYADPVDSNRIYKPGFTLYVSNEAGKSFTSPFVEGGRVHSDIHALWVNPSDNDHLYLGSDGGAYVSYDGGSTWNMLLNLPVSTFYHVAADRQKPYNVYGGLQDNGSWMGPSKAPSGILNKDWNLVGYGDGFNVIPDPHNDNIIYWQFQGGMFHRYYKDRDESKEIKPYSENIDDQFRFNWNSPIAFSPSQKGIFYVGSQYLHKTTDGGDSWQIISPDLTTDDPGKQRQEETGGLTIDNSTAENHCTIYCINESPLDPQIIWTGTDDGNLQITTDGGTNWKNVAGNVPSLPSHTWVSSVTPSNHSRETAYVTFDGHRTGDMRTYVYVTTDLGKTWESLTTEKLNGYAHIIMEDPAKPDLLYLGTEFGLFISIDRGSSWVRFEAETPKVSVRDMVIQPDNHDLILATHGRGILILDDLELLRQLTDSVLRKDVHLFTSEPYYIRSASGRVISGDQQFIGSNPSSLAEFSFYLKKRHIFGELKAEVYNDKGELVQQLPAGKRKGINTITWNVRRKPPKVKVSSPLLLYRVSQGPTYPPGDYTIKLTKDKNVFTGTISIAFDPESPYSLEDRELQYATVDKAYEMLEEISFLSSQISDALQKINIAAGKLEEGTLKNELMAAARKMEDKLEYLIVTDKIRVNAKVRLREKISNVYAAVLNYQGRPGDNQIRRLNALDDELKAQREEFDIFLKEELHKINVLLTEAGVEPVSVITEEEYLKENE